ncbi:putative histidinol-phosphate transaminase [Violaceomyces palustris]|uniref:Histidinol-phosphate transaminase n=1 Tax=Violaceomyces palustris TaxID=1673888 RepID=A0ACD0NWN5_9BASI|nr:putative histidinol-phosphate transaminase [Violaceomyces palustris]
MTIKGLDPNVLSQVRSQKPPHFKLEKVIRKNILNLEPYRCARDDYQQGILLDANENSLGHSLPQNSSIPHDKPSTTTNGSSSSSSTPIKGSGSDDDLSLHRYPDPSLHGIKSSLAKLRRVPNQDFICLGVGSDEILDLIQRCCANPGKDKILICPPTYGMYSVCAAVNDVEVVKVPLITEGGRFSLDVERVNQVLSQDPAIKLVFLCSPGNPTGTLLPLSDVVPILENPKYDGIVVVDEAYIDFAEEERNMGRRDPSVEVSAVSLVDQYQNLLVTQTLSKAFGLAAIRLGIAFGQPPLIQIMNNTKAPYNISVPTAHLASLALSEKGLEKMRANVRTLIRNRDELIRDLSTVKGCGEVLGSNQANFVLVRILDPQGKPSNEVAQSVYRRMAEERGLVVRNRSKDLGCDACLRITVGTKEENERCISLMKQLLENDGQWTD